MRLAHQRGEEGIQGVIAGHILGAVGRDDEEWEGRGAAGNDAEQVKTRGIGPMQIVEEEQHGTTRRYRDEEVVN